MVYPGCTRRVPGTSYPRSQGPATPIQGTNGRNRGSNMAKTGQTWPNGSKQAATWPNGSKRVKRVYRTSKKGCTVPQKKGVPDLRSSVRTSDPVSGLSMETVSGLSMETVSGPRDSVRP